MFEVGAFKLLVWAAWIGAIVWLLLALITLVWLARRKSLRAATPGQELMTESAPLISIIVPARNEEGRVLQDCIHSILAQDYGRFEVIAVNDRSTDATAMILHHIAQDDERLRVIEGAELPAGWLGKPYALQQALDAAQGEWVLATDADMIFDKAALRTGLAHTLEHQVDALTLIPHFAAHSFWERVMIPVWSWVMMVYILFSRVNHPRSQAAIGIGGFFLIRRAALKRIGDYHGLCDEVLDDMRLAEKLKASGARMSFEYAPALMSTRMYTNFREMWECSTKNWFSGMKFSVILALAAVLSMYVFAVAPPVGALVCVLALAAGANLNLWSLFIPFFTIWIIQVSFLAALNRRCQVPLVYALLTPLGFAVLYAMLFDSTVRIASGRGVTWKGRKVYERASGVRPPRIGRQATNLPFADD